MSESDEVAGYQDILTGSHDVPATQPGTAHVHGAGAPELKALLGIAVGTLSVAALYVGRSVLIPIMLAVMLSFVLSPVVNFLQRLRLWRGPAVILTVLAALALLVTAGTLIANQAAALTANAPQYAHTIEGKIEGVQSYWGAKLAKITKSFDTGHKPAAAPTPTPEPAPLQSPQADELPDNHAVPVRVVQAHSSTFTIARSVLAPILSPLETTIIVVIVAIFILMQREDLRDRFIRLFGSNDLQRTTRALDDAGQRLSKYFLSQLAVNSCFGLVIGFGLLVIGIPTPAMWGLMAGLLRFVPYVGSLLAATVPAALGAAIDPGWSMAIWVVALFFTVDLFTGYVIEPLLYGHSTGLSPVSVIVSAIFWTWLWGPIGLIMSTPLTLCLVVMGRHVKSLEFFDVLLGDRPALTPVESFYQRILADNPDEALAQAETLLEDRGLVDYYDQVVVSGLRLAVDDQARGTINKARAQQLTRATLSVIHDLNDHVDTIEHHVNRLPEVTLLKRQLVCVAGHGSFDTVVSIMLAQLLQQRGLKPGVLANARVSRQEIDQLDLAEVDVIVISYLELGGSPAELRYLIRRLRQRAPAAKIVVGLWNEGEPALSDKDNQQAIGADRYVASLGGAVDIVVKTMLAADLGLTEAA